MQDNFSLLVRKAVKVVPVAAGNITIHIVKGQISKQKVAIPYVVLFNLCLRCMYMYTQASIMFNLNKHYIH